MSHLVLRYKATTSPLESLPGLSRPFRVRLHPSQAPCCLLECQVTQSDSLFLQLFWYEHMLSGLDADCRIGRVLPSKSSQAVTSVLSTRFGSYSLQVPQWSGQRLLRGLNLLLCLYLNIELPFYLSGRKKCTITTVVQLLICPQAIILVKCLILVLLHTCLICSVTAAVHLCIPPKTCLSCSARPT